MTEEKKIMKVFADIIIYIDYDDKMSVDYIKENIKKFIINGKYKIKTITFKVPISRDISENFAAALYSPTISVLIPSCWLVLSIWTPRSVTCSTKLCIFSKPKPTAIAVQEFLKKNVYFRNPSKENKTDF